MGQYIHHTLEVSPVYLSTISIENANDAAHTLSSSPADFLAGIFTRASYKVKNAGTKHLDALRSAFAPYP
jgi:hypothetical protein